MRPLQIASLVGLAVLVMTSLYLIRQRPTIFSKESYFDKPQGQQSSSISMQQEVIMGFMGNKTQKAELGRATWKFLHTMMARYPETPSAEERQALHDFMMLFSRLYPCGECAVHFNKMLQLYPPQTSSRLAASEWLCTMHNKVNEKIHKPIFDCRNILEHYPCGCEDAETTTSATTATNIPAALN